MKISIIGTGYVGLVCGACLAKKGHDVICVDSQREIADRINNSEAVIFEPYLSEYIGEAVAEGRLLATTDIEYGVASSEISIVCVDTPYKNGSIDLNNVEKAVRDIGRILRIKNPYHVICIKSTVIPSATDTLVKNILEEESGKKAGEFGLVMNPEFLREGEAVTDFMNPDRIVIGAYDDRSYEHFKMVYEGYFEAPLLRVSLRTAELIKYASNSLLAMLISYSNEIAAISEAIGGLDAEEVLYGVTLDKRISPQIDGKFIRPEIVKYLKSGRGYGGSCFPKDLRALIAFTESLGYAPKLLRATAEINEMQVGKITDRLEKELNGLEGKKILVLGLAFKQNSDDIRESPAIRLVKLLSEKEAVIYAADPMATEKARKALEGYRGICFLEGYKKTAISFDAAVLMTPWQEYLDFLNEGSSASLKTALLFDGCRALDKYKFNESGIKYMGVGIS